MAVLHVNAQTTTRYTTWRRDLASAVVLAAAAIVVVASVPLVFGAPRPQVHIRWREISVDATRRPRAAVWPYRSYSTGRRRVELCADRHVTGTSCCHCDRARGGRHGWHQPPDLCHLRCAATHAAARWTARRAAVDAQSDHAPQLHARVAVRALVGACNCDVPGPARGAHSPAEQLIRSSRPAVAYSGHGQAVSCQRHGSGRFQGRLSRRPPGFSVQRSPGVS